MVRPREGRQATNEPIREANKSETLRPSLEAENVQLRERLERLEGAYDELENFVSSTQSPALLLDEDLRFKLLTPAARGILQLDRSVVGRSVFEVPRELLQMDLAREAKMVLKSAHPVSRELLVSTGQHYLRRILPYRRAGHRVEGAVVTFDDVSELREASDELNQKTNRLELAWEAARGGIFEHRVPIDESTYVSDQWAQVLGYRTSELPPYGQLLNWLAEQAHPEDRQHWENTYRDVLVGKANRYSIELRFRHQQGHWIWVRKIAKVLDRGEDGKARHLLRMMIDITDQKKVEASLKESEVRFRTLAGNISQLAWMADGRGWIFWYNRRWYEYTGTSLSEMAGWGWRSVHHPDHLDRVVAKVSHCFETGTPWEDTFPLRGVDGQYRWFLSSAVPIRDESGEVIRWFGTNTDVTHLREVEEKLVEADRQKDEFIAMLGHELRNPLAAIRTASELLKWSADASPGIHQAQRVLERQTAHMSTLLDGLLDVSRIIQGKIRLELEVLDFGAICAEVAQDITGNGGTGRLEIRTHVPLQPVWVVADRVRLAQIVSNLLSNAVKYTPDDGTVTLTLRQEGDKAVLRVEDTGVGIEAELLPHVFEIFRQSTQSIDRSHGGLGLGLALVKTLVDMQGGTIEAKSAGRGQGAEFVLELPMSAAGPAAPEERISPVRRRMRLVLIEDNEDAAEMLKQLLELTGHQVWVAHTGALGVALVRAKVPDAVLCDLGLPGMNGFQVAQALRADEELAGVQLVAVSGYGRPEDKAQSLEAGFDAHLTKPVDLKSVERLLDGSPGKSETRT